MQRSRTLPPGRAREPRAGGEGGRRTRFSEWAGEKAPPAAARPAEPKAASPEETFLVLNDFLKSKSRGIKFRTSPNIEDRCKVRVAPFSSLVKGVRYNADWVQVSKYFLPMKVDGKYVLMVHYTNEVEDFEEDLRPKVAEDVNPMLANHVRNKMEARMVALEEAKARALRQREDDVSGLEFLKPSPSRLSRQRSPRARSPREKPERGLPPTSPPEVAERGLPPRPREPARPKGTGVFFKVVGETLDVQSEPGEGGARVPARAKRQDDVLELFDWDETRQWRLMFDNLGWNRPSVPGWVKLDDAVQGPLLRPVDKVYQGSWLGAPLEPVCLAVKEKSLRDLRRFIADGADLNARDADGLTPLMLAALGGLADFCVYLLAGGADAGQLTKGQNKSAADFAERAPLKAVIDALAGKEYFSMSDYDLALEALKPEVAEEAERVFNRMAEHKEATRRREQAFAPDHHRLDQGEEEEEDAEETLRREQEAEQERVRRERERLFREYEEERARKEEAEREKWRLLEEKLKQEAREEESLRREATEEDLPPLRPAPEPDRSRDRADQLRALRDRSRDRADKLRALREQAARRRAEPEAPKAALSPSSPKEPEQISPARSQAKAKATSLWICSDCGFETPTTRAICDFCDMPRGRDAPVI